jgi:hypothetical protein
VSTNLQDLWDVSTPIEAPTPAAAPAEDLAAAWETAEPIPAAPTAPTVENDEDAFVARMFADAFAGDVDRRAAAVRLSERTGASLAFVEDNLEAVRQSWEASQRDPRRWRTENPRLAALLRERPELGPVVLRDERVSGFTKALRGAPGAARALEEGTAALLAMGEAEKEQLPWYSRLAITIAGWGLPKPSGEPIPQDQVVEFMRASGAAPPRQVPYVDDSRALEAQRRTGLSRLAVPFMAVQDQLKAQEASEVGFSLLTSTVAGLDTLGDEQRLADLRAQLAPRDYGEGWEQILVDAASPIASQVAMAKGAGVGAAVGAALGAVVGAVTTRTPGGAVAGGRIGMALGGRAGAVGAAFRLEAGGAFLEYREATTDSGERVSTEVAAGAALIYGALASVVETASFGATAKSFGPLGEAVFAGEGKAFIAKLLGENTFRQLAARTAKAWAQRAGTEGVEEFVQTVLEDALGYAGRSVEAGELQEARPLETIEAGLEAGRVAVVGTALTGAGGPAVTLATAAIRRDASARSAAQVEAIHGLAGGPAATASPSTVAELVKRETEATGEAVTHLYLDPQETVRFFQENEADPAVLLGPDAAAKITEALASGTKIEVPVAQYLEGAAALPGSERLVEHIATRPGYMTAAELKRLSPEALAESAKELAEKIVSEDIAPEPGAETALVAVLERQLAATGVQDRKQAKFSVALWRAFLRTQAERMGLPADVLFREYTLRVERAGGVAAQALPIADLVPPKPDVKPAPSAAPAPTPASPPAGAPPVAMSTAPAEPGVAAVEAPPVPTVGAVAPAPVAEAQARTQEQAAAAPALAPEFAAVRAANREAGLVLVPAPSPAPAPAPAPVTVAGGSATRVITPQRPQGEPAHYAVIEAEELIPSHDENSFQPNPAYPAGVQEREYHRQREEQMKVVRGAQQLNPALLLADSPTAVDGPPLVTAGDRALVLGGNGRSMMLKRALRDPETRESYRAALAAKAQAFGLDPEAIARMRAPVLVRVLEDVPATAPASELVAAVRRTNEALTQALSPRARAVAEARNMSPETVTAIAGLFSEDGEATLRDVMRDRPRELIDILRRDGIITAQNQSSWVAGGLITDEAKERLEGMFLGRIVGSGDRMAQTPPAVLAKLERLVPSLLRVAGVNPEFDEIPTVQAALDLLNDAKRRGLKLRELVTQGDLFAETRHDPAAVALAQLLDREKPTTLAKRFREWAELAAFDPRQITMFAPNPSRAEAREKLTGGVKLEQEGTAARGWMERVGDAFRVVLNPKADLSTFLHESGHIFLEIMGDLAAREDAPEAVRTDYRAILSWLGVADRSEIKREHHEKWARGFEAYLREGKTPSALLRRPFERFRIWLSRIYREAKSLDVDLNDEIRGVFDRMLATDEEIVRARRRAGVPDLVRQPWMDDAAWEAAKEAIGRAQRAERKAAEIRALEERKREVEAWWREELAKEREQAERDYDELRETKAWRYLRFSELGGQRVDPPLRLNREEVERLVGREAAKRLTGVLVKRGGESLQEIAEQFGYRTGQELLAAVLSHPTKDVWARNEAQKRMRAKHSDIETDRETLAKMIADAQHSDEGYGDAILREWVSVGALAGGRSVPVEAIRLLARQTVEARELGKLSYGRVLADERRAADRFAHAIAKRDYAGAYEAKGQQLFNHFLYREIGRAIEGKERFEKLAAELGDNARRARVGKADPGLRDLTDALLVHLGLREADPDVPPFPGVSGILAALADAAVEPVFDPEAITRILIQPREWEGLTVGEAAQLVPVLQQLKHAGVVVSEMAVAEQRRTIYELADLIAEEARTQPDLGLAPKDEAFEAEKRRWKLNRQGLIADYTDPEEYFRRLGPTAHAAFWGRFMAGQAREAELAGTVLPDLLRALDAMPKELYERRFDTVDSSMLPVSDRTRRDETPTTREWLWMVVLNWGNDGNRQRLLDGYGWTEDQVQGFIEANITREELEFLQAILDITEKLREPMEAVYQRVTGVRQGRVQAVPIVVRLADGTTWTGRGGYFPARYDPQSRDPSGVLGLRQAEAGIQDARQSAAATIAKSFTKSRAARYSGAINLSWAAVPQHIAQVIHYAAFEEYIRDATRLLANDKVKETIERRLGQPFLPAIKGWLKRVAANHEGDPNDSRSFNAIVGALRTRTVNGALMYSTSVSAPDVLNLVNPLITGKVSARSMSRALRRAMSVTRDANGALRWGFAEMRREALRASVELRKREDNLRDVLQHRLHEIGPRGNRGKVERLRDAVIDNGYFVAEGIDKVVSTLIWWASREDRRQAEQLRAREAQIRGERLEQDALPLEVVESVEDAEAAAVAHADDIVRRHQVIATMLEQPKMLADRKGWGAYLAMFSFWSRIGNLHLQMRHEAETRTDQAKAAARTWALLIVANTLGSLLGGAGPEEDEELWEWALRKALAAPVLILPVVGGPLEQVVGSAVSSLIHRELTLRKASFFNSPAIAVVERIGGAVVNALKADEPAEAIGPALEAAAFMCKLPVSQPKRSGGYWLDVFLGEEEPKGVLDVMSGTFYGNRKNKPEDPFSLAQDYLEGER